jgi:uncharacterized YigZ family protein
MSEQDFYQTIEQNAVAEFKDRGSRFLAYAFPIKNVEEFKARLNELKAEHPKAVHHCFAYRIGLDGNNFRVSDDGEPSGSAGWPILGQIDSKQLTNVLVVVVRYFGGTLLGVPGLINAYKTVTSLALQLVPVIQKPVTITWKIHFDYTQMNDVMRWLKAFNCIVVSQEMNLFCSITTEVPKQRMHELKQILAEMRNIEVQTIV